MADPLQKARDLAAALVAELARPRPDAPDNQVLNDAEQAAQLVVARLAACGIVDPPEPDATLPGASQESIEPPYPNVADPDDSA